MWQHIGWLVLGLIIGAFIGGNVALLIAAWCMARGRDEATVDMKQWAEKQRELRRQ